MAFLSESVADLMAGFWQGLVASLGKHVGEVFFGGIASLSADNHNIYLSRSIIYPLTGFNPGTIGMFDILNFRDRIDQLTQGFPATAPSHDNSLL